MDAFVQLYSSFLRLAEWNVLGLSYHTVDAA